MAQYGKFSCHHFNFIITCRPEIVTAPDPNQGPVQVPFDVPRKTRRRVPETINFHPLRIKYQRDMGFAGWTQEKFDEVAAANAPDVFKRKGEERDSPVDIRPVDGLLAELFIGNIFHEVLSQRPRAPF
ncbi:hypothetical protein DL770_005830 [Monosporascus sp. CRB-9-2]|nr:hypothetical protein DL770_005830 [Monosporascus sp. CRB-9-2]